MCHSQGQSRSCSGVLLFAVLWVLARDPGAQGESLWRAQPLPGMKCVPLTCAKVVFPKAAKREILQMVIRWTACISWAWISAMLVSVGKYCVVNGWKCNVCCEFVGLKHWKFFIRQCLHTSPEEPLRVYIWNLKNILSCFKTICTAIKVGVILTLNMYQVSYLLKSCGLFCASVFSFPIRPCRKLCSCYW